MNYNTLQYFVDIVNLKSFTRAAEKNFVAQTALSHAITKVERDLGAQLLIRKPGNITLTEAGKIFYQECESVLVIHQDTLTKIQNLKQNRRTIQIGFIDIYETKRFVKLNRILEETFPEKNIEWANRYGVPEEKLDIIIGYDYERAPEGKWELKNAIVRQAGFLVANVPPFYKKEKIHLKELAGQNLIVLARDRNLNLPAMAKHYKKEYKECKDCHIKYVFSELEARALVECGRGIARFENNLYKYDHKTCKFLKSEEPYELIYNIYYKNGMEAIAEIMKEYIES